MKTVMLRSYVKSVAPNVALDKIGRFLLHQEHFLRISEVNCDGDDHPSVNYENDDDIILFGDIDTQEMSRKPANMAK